MTPTASCWITTTHSSSLKGKCDDDVFERSSEEGLLLLLLFPGKTTTKSVFEDETKTRGRGRRRRAGVCSTSDLLFGTFVCPRTFCDANYYSVEMCLLYDDDEQNYYYYSRRRQTEWTLASFLAFFLVVFVRYAIPNGAKMFGTRRRRFARDHRLSGMLHLLVLASGGALLLRRHYKTHQKQQQQHHHHHQHAKNDDAKEEVLFWVAYDVLLALSGIRVTSTAISDFGQLHSRVRDEGSDAKSSGVLHETKTVATSEMKEHLFYQRLNLVQILYLHFCDAWEEDDVCSVVAKTTGLALATTLGWASRKRYPVNSFSKNYSGDGGGKGENGGTFDSLENFLYRAKKWQYVFYKTCLLHGLNVSAAIGFGRSRSDRSSTSGTFFQLYWLCLNASYVMEFFLQTLVKKKYGTQSNVLFMNQFLMCVSSFSALPIVMNRVHPIAFLAAFALNFLNRKKELTNVCLAFAACVAFENRHVLLYNGAR